MNRHRLFAASGIFVLLIAGIAPGAMQNLTRAQFADGSGSVGLAPGWKMTDSGNGAVQLKGPHDTGMALGIPVPVVSRNVAAQFPAIPSSALFPGTPRVDLQNPVRAMLDIIAANARKSPSAAIKNVKIKAVEEVAVPNGRGAFVRWSATQGGKPAEIFGLYAIMPVDNTQGMFYMSFVQGSKESYAKQLPTMMAMWRSWSLSNATLQKRLRDAQKTLGEIDVIGTSDAIMAERRNVAEKAAREFQEYIRQ